LTDRLFLSELMHPILKGSRFSSRRAFYNVTGQISRQGSVPMARILR
jgi:uncharacterized membrane protein